MILSNKVIDHPVNLEFDSIEISHFKSFAAKQTLSFAHRTSGTYFMRGRNEVEPCLSANGSGKSSVFDSLVWCLYGRTASGLKNPDLKSWGSSLTPIVSLKLKLDGKSHTVTRSATTNGLEIDGQTVGNDEAAKLVGLDFDIFINTILLAQGQPLFFDRTPKDKMQLFATVLNLERWEERSATALAKVRELEQLEAELKGELTGAEAALVQTEELLKKTQERSAEWLAERQKLNTNAEAELKEKCAVLEKQRAKLDSAELVWDGVATELKALRKTLPDLNRKARVTDADYSTALLKSGELGREIKRLETELDALDKARECPTCGQPIKKANLKEHKAELEEQLAALETALEDLPLAKLKEATQAAETALKRAQDDERGYADREDVALTTLTPLKVQVAELQAQVNSLSTVQIQQKDQTNPFTEQVQDLRRKKAQTEVSIQGLEEDLTKAARQIERTKFWVRGFKDVALYCIEEVLQELEITTNVMLTEVGLEGWRVEYLLEKETKSGTMQRGLNVSIYSPHNKQTVRYESWSGGEGQRLRIVGALALSEVLLNHAGVSCNLEVLDEPTQHLSASGVKDLCEYLSERARRLEKKIIVIDHMARESTDFAGVITVVKTPKGSIIEE